MSMNFSLLTSWSAERQVNNCNQMNACISVKLMHYSNITHNSYFKSASKYSGSNLVNQQGDLQWKIAKKGKKLLCGFFIRWVNWVGFHRANSHYILMMICITNLWSHMEEVTDIPSTFTQRVKPWQYSLITARVKNLCCRSEPNFRNWSDPPPKKIGSIDTKKSRIKYNIIILNSFFKSIKTYMTNNYRIQLRINRSGSENLSRIVSVFYYFMILYVHEVVTYFI